MNDPRAQQPYTYYAIVDNEGVIRESGAGPTQPDAAADRTAWERETGLRFIEHDLRELVTATTHYFDDDRIKRRDRPESAPPANAPVLRQRRNHDGYH